MTFTKCVYKVLLGNKNDKYMQKAGLVKIMIF